MTNSPVKVSVVLPVYNAMDTLPAAIQSIRSQTWQDWELIILDDGSDDGSFDVALSAAREDSRILVHKHTRNLGLAKTMNDLVSLAAGELIAIQEQDDRSKPQRLERQVSLLDEKPQVGIVSALAAWVDQQGNLLGYFPGLLQRGNQYPQELNDMVRFLYVEQCKVVNACCMIRRSVLEQVEGLFDEQAKMSIDWQFFIHAAHFTQFWGIPEVLVEMLRDDSHAHLTSQKTLQFSEARRCIQLIYEKYKGDPQSPIDRSLRKKAMLTESLLESRNEGAIRGLGKFLKCLISDPANPKVWEHVRWAWQRILRRLK